MQDEKEVGKSTLPSVELTRSAIDGEPMLLLSAILHLRRADRWDKIIRETGTAPAGAGPISKEIAASGAWAGSWMEIRGDGQLDFCFGEYLEGNRLVGPLERREGRPPNDL